MLRKLFGLAFLLVGLGTLAGCGAGKAELTGTVTIRGTKLDKGVITFIPEAGSDAPTVAATIQDGAYTIPEIMYGKYKVTITPAHAEGAVGGKPDKPLKPGEVDPTRPAGGASKGATMLQSNVAIPEKVRSAETSGLGVTVDKSKMEYPVTVD